MEFFKTIWNDFYACFIKYDSYNLYLKGLRNTLIIAIGACVLGLLIGIIVTCIRVAPKNNVVVKACDWIARLYVTVIRGTPVVLQLFICYFVLLTSLRSEKFFNLSDTAGRSLGMSWIRTFFLVVLPQALKSAIPTMFNEFITLVKETSVAGYVGITDLTKIQSFITTYSMKLYMPLFIIAAIYLVVVLLLQQLQRLIERRLKKSDRN